MPMVFPMKIIPSPWNDLHQRMQEKILLLQLWLHSAIRPHCAWTSTEWKCKTKWTSHSNHLFPTDHTEHARPGSGHDRWTKRTTRSEKTEDFCGFQTFLPYFLMFANVYKINWIVSPVRRTAIEVRGLSDCCLADWCIQWQKSKVKRKKKDRLLMLGSWIMSGQSELSETEQLNSTLLTAVR